MGCVFLFVICNLGPAVYKVNRQWLDKTRKKNQDKTPSRCNCNAGRAIAKQSQSEKREQSQRAARAKLHPIFLRAVSPCFRAEMVIFPPARFTGRLFFPETGSAIQTQMSKSAVGGFKRLFPLGFDR